MLYIYDDRLIFLFSLMTCSWIASNKCDRVDRDEIIIRSKKLSNRFVVAAIILICVSMRKDIIWVHEYELKSRNPQFKSGTVAISTCSNSYVFFSYLVLRMIKQRIDRLLWAFESVCVCVWECECKIVPEREIQNIEYQIDENYEKEWKILKRKRRRRWNTETSSALKYIFIYYYSVFFLWMHNTTILSGYNRVMVQLEKITCESINLF